MCIFSEPVEAVSNTRIFGRRMGSRQALVYAMSVSLRAADTAMILPLPVPPDLGEDCLHFLSLEDYPGFFDDLRDAFPVETVSFGVPVEPAAVLKVHDVGAYEASYVPSAADFDRLDPRFRLPAGVLDQFEQYRDFGFAVFRLRGSAGQLHLEVHPMAFTFPTRLEDTIFFPTVHVHHGKVAWMADFDHELYAQLRGPEEKREYWEPTPLAAGAFMQVERCHGLVDPDRHCHRFRREGLEMNEDTVLEA